MTALKISGMRALGKSACTVCLAVFLLNANAEEALDDKTVTSRLVGYWFNISGARSEDAGIHIEVHTLTYAARSSNDGKVAGCRPRIH